MSEISLASEPANDQHYPGNVSDSSMHRICDDPLTKWEKSWVWMGERVNPIVVKEVRQSLKSRQFTIAFGLTLIAAIGWTILGISVMVPRIYYMPAGMPLLAGFFCILNLPLMVIIPYSAFRSLASETDDSTFELLSISALSSTQIVNGKMSSACVQILLYLSALAPSIVLTYLLRGVGLTTILFLLGLTVAFSLAETSLALLLAAVSNSRMLQTLSSVFVLAGLLMAFFMWTTFLVGAGIPELGSVINNPPKIAYLVVFAICTIIAIAISLVLRAAAAAIDFPSENNSTPLRFRIVGLVALILFWGIMAIVAFEESAPATALCLFFAGELTVLGVLMTGERGVVSPRAQRSLPKTFLGRVGFTWFFPGAGLGYIFILCLYASVVSTLYAVDEFYGFGNDFGDMATLQVGFYCLCYMAIYLGINRLLMMLVPKHVPGRMLGAVAMFAVVLLMTHLIPLLIVYYANDYRAVDYGWHQSLNIVMTLNELADKGTFVLGLSTALITLFAVSIFGLNLVLSTRDVMMIRIAQPPRVQDDEAREEQVEQPEAPDPFGE